MAVKIYCPKCEWAPGRHDEWECRPGCGTVWNTFETRGRCPGCSKRWLVTVCLACLVGSLHARWYHHEAGDADAARDAAETHDEEHDEELVEVGGGVGSRLSPLSPRLSAPGACAFRGNRGSTRMHADRSE